MPRILGLLFLLLSASFAFGADAWRALPGRTNAVPSDPAAVTRIYNGVPTADFPAVAGLAIFNRSGAVAGCSGTLVSPQVVLTAAHCVDDSPFRIDAVFFPDGVQAVYGVQQYAIHPEYSTVRLAVADIALLLLADPVAGVTPVPLATKSPRAGRKAVIVGYGQDETGSSGLKQFGSIKLKRCPRRFAAAGLSAGQLSRSLCWRPGKNGQDTCHGDSGGPLLVKSALVGVTSGGFGDCPGLLSWDTNVVPFRDWIAPLLL